MLVFTLAPLLKLRPDGRPAKLPEITGTASARHSC
jgi:hypothetical protein